MHVAFFTSVRNEVKIGVQFLLIVDLRSSVEIIGRNLSKRSNMRSIFYNVRVLCHPRS